MTISAALTVLPILLALSGCLNSSVNTVGDKAARPSIAYVSPVTDTQYVATAHAVASTGGPVTRYTVLYPPFTGIMPEGNWGLPEGLTLDTLTGLIWGTPGYGSGGTSEDYSVIAIGPGGADTAVIRIDIQAVGPGPGATNAQLVLSVGIGVVNGSAKTGVLGKSSMLTLRKLIVTLTSDIGADKVIRDTIVSGSEGFNSDAYTAQQVELNYSLKPLRSWTVSVEALDARDSAVYRGVASATNLMAGESRLVGLGLALRYQEYEATLLLPDSIYSPSALFGHRLNITRIALVVDGIVLDDSAATRLTSTSSLTLSSHYAPRDADSVTVQVYGNIPSAGAPYNTGGNLLYSASIPTLFLTGSSTFSLPWRGPFTGVQGLSITVRRVSHIFIDDGPPPVILPKRRAR